MKAFAIVLTVILVLVFALTGYLFLTCQVSAVSVSMSSVEAEAQIDLFNLIQNEFRLNAVVGTPFSDSVGSSAKDYKFCTYQIHLKNSCFLPATTLEAAISPLQGDILQLPDTTQHLLPSRSEGILECTLLTGIQMHTVRELQITYYIWGIPFSFRVIASQE